MSDLATIVQWVCQAPIWYLLDGLVWVLACALHLLDHLTFPFIGKLPLHSLEEQSIPDLSKCSLTSTPLLSPTPIVLQIIHYQVQTVKHHYKSHCVEPQHLQT